MNLVSFIRFYVFLCLSGVLQCAIIILPILIVKFSEQYVNCRLCAFGAILASFVHF